MQLKLQVFPKNLVVFTIGFYMHGRRNPPVQKKNKGEI